jgi:ketosteroid isomerase-like protein
MIKMNRFFAVCTLLVLSLSFTSVAGQVGGKSKAESEIRQLENRRIQAMLKVDTEELNRLLADDLTYTHSSGQVDTKSQLIESLKSGERKYQMIEPQDVKVRLYGDAAIVTGRARLKTISKGQEFNFQVQFTDVYAKKKGRWQMVAWQSSRLPEQ